MIQNQIEEKKPTKMLDKQINYQNLLLNEYRANPKFKNRFLLVHSYVVKEWLKSMTIFKLKNTYL